MRRNASSVIGACLALALASAVVVLTPSSALSQAYPQPCNVLSGTQSLGDVTVGQRFSFQLAPGCTFTPGTTVSINVNGVVFTKVANAAGFVDVTVNVLSQTEMEVNPRVPARCGVNTITGTGPSTVAGGRQVTQSASFNLLCGAAAPKAATPVRGRLSLTGANTVPLAAAAFALLMVGALLTVASRRRAAART